MSKEKSFPNGFASWMETHHEIVSAIAIDLNRCTPWSKRLLEISESQGTGGIYELAEELTDKFEKKYEGKEWDGDFFDVIEVFIDKELL